MTATTATRIASNLTQVEKLNASIRAMNHALTQPQHAHLKHSLSVRIEAATMQVSNLMFWVRHWAAA